MFSLSWCEINHNLFTKCFYLNVTAGNGIFQRFDHILGGVTFATILILFTLLNVKVGLGDVSRLLRHVLGDRRRR